MAVPIVRTVSDLRKTVAGWRTEGFTVGLVPTMGALHEGHLSLIRAGLARTDRVIVTLFVNPKQFNNPEDLAAYPRTEGSDATKLAVAGAHLLYAPNAEEIYPEGFSTTVSVAGASEGMEGSFRPGHFEGVATVVAKLFLQSGAGFAFFGEKDFQQLQVVRRMARDLDIPIEVVACPTVREADGLAMSSRNVYLTPAERALAPRLAAILFGAAEKLAAGAEAGPLLAASKDALGRAGFGKVEYIELRSEASLASLTRASEPARLLAAVWLGEVRLIDNVAVAAQPANLVANRPGS
ncbi:pantoate--beta-alanine ligase [Mesorhizobium sp. YM1C-6-2]|uniref:pantoate--beta-alanine ligase n=1 Tax=Mesorhizobium sp. YM1C-6-2 TaxID=1827501 RepID=UPI000EF26659|nr:pantoate--beta-alanine ligase [Mesorhizobium sp. YM1C-6-2]RLP28048.1 pantoate--beta-alanine ligase [Mesorhizobium sp. YM1C-6-2]